MTANIRRSFTFEGSDVVPAESVYAAFEVKQVLDAGTVSYAQDKIASVRRLHRTSLPIPSAGGLLAPKPLHHILGGALALVSGWSPALGTPLLTLLQEASTDRRIDIGCVSAAGTFECTNDCTFTFDTAQGTGARFLLSLIARLQEIATVPMIDVRAYAAWLK
jgi:hypothetical protein